MKVKIFPSFLFSLLFLDLILKFVFVRWGMVTINKGISFSLFSNSNLTFSLHLGALIVLTNGYFLFSSKANWAVNKFYLFLIILAGFSNFFDRIFYGGVVDYINLYFFKNNLTDLVIFLGVCGLILNQYIKPSK